MIYEVEVEVRPRAQTKTFKRFVVADSPKAAKAKAAEEAASMADGEPVVTSLAKLMDKHELCRIMDLADRTYSGFARQGVTLETPVTDCLAGKDIGDTLPLFVGLELLDVFDEKRNIILNFSSAANAMQQAGEQLLQLARAFEEASDAEEKLQFPDQ